MKIIAQPIEVISHTDSKGEIRPLRFRFKQEDESLRVIKVDKVIIKEKEKLAGNPMLAFRCEGVVEDTVKLFEIKYELSTCRWILYKI